MNSYSQCGQDLFAWKTCNKTTEGTFLDVGCNDGHEHSNTLSLEEIGWTGLLLDHFHFPRVETRRSPLVIGDALKVNWEALIGEHFKDPSFIDYLSLDVDESTTEALSKIIAVHARFGVISVEHDAYRVGNIPRHLQRDLLIRNRYKLVKADVPVGPGPWGNGGPFEDWWTS